MVSAGKQRALAAVWIAAMVAAVIALAFQLGPETGDDTTPASAEGQAEQSEQTDTGQRGERAGCRIDRAPADDPGR